MQCFLYQAKLLDANYQQDVEKRPYDEKQLPIDIVKSNGIIQPRIDSNIIVHDYPQHINKVCSNCSNNKVNKFTETGHVRLLEQQQHN